MGPTWPRNHCVISAIPSAAVMEVPQGAVLLGLFMKEDVSILEKERTDGLSMVKETTKSLQIIAPKPRKAKRVIPDNISF